MRALLFSGVPCYDAPLLADGLAEHKKPFPPDFARANSLINPLGREPARGWLLLLRRDLDRLDLDGLHRLDIEDDRGNKARAEDLVITKEPLCLSPSVTPADPGAAYLVEVADARWRVSNPHYCVPVNKSYNVRAPAYQGAGDETEFYMDSLDGSDPWTWARMVADLWDLMADQLGETPAELPFEPDGQPEGWIFPGVPAWSALCDVLDRIGCAVAWEPGAGTYAIVRVGDEDEDTDTLLADLAKERPPRKIHDGEYLPVVRGKVAHSVRVLFHRLDVYGTAQTTTREPAQWQTSSVYNVDVEGPDTDSAEPGTFALLWDDLPARYDPDGALANEANLIERANERADDYYRQLRPAGGARLWQQYAGIVPVAPGSLLKLVAWRQTAEGDLITEIVRHPYRQLRITEDGRWRENAGGAGSVPVQPPAFGPTWPLWPPPGQIVEIITGTPTAGLFDGVLLHSNGVGGFSDEGEIVWVQDLASTGSLTAGHRFPAQITGYTDGRPLVALRSGPGTAVCASLQALPGYSGSVVQLLGHDATGACRWYNVSVCP